ncbi:MAG: hypothetical protein PHH04_00880 [Thomasclavelia sp.]|nr:hypothetical protein [Thomasclavelia sp.]
MTKKIEEKIKLLFDKNSVVGDEALKYLTKLSDGTNIVYPYMDSFKELLSSDNSYMRTRGVILLARNAKWDKEGKLNGIIDDYLKHITDNKPITSRQCIKSLPLIVKYKPELTSVIVSALKSADTTIYNDSMKPLVDKDIQKALEEIQKL